MKPLVKKLLESGIIDKHAALMMERWKTLESGAADLVGTDPITTRRGLEKFAEEIEELLDKEEETVRETPLDLPLKNEQSYFAVVGVTNSQFLGHWDVMGCLVVDPTTVLHRGTVIRDARTKLYWRALDTAELYQDEKVIARRITVEKM